MAACLLCGVFVLLFILLLTQNVLTLIIYDLQMLRNIGALWWDFNTQITHPPFLTIAPACQTWLPWNFPRRKRCRRRGKWGDFAVYLHNYMVWIVFNLGLEVAVLPCGICSRWHISGFNLCLRINFPTVWHQVFAPGGVNPCNICLLCCAALISQTGFSFSHRDLAEWGGYKHFLWTSAHKLFFLEPPYTLWWTCIGVQKQFLL